MFRTIPRSIWLTHSWGRRRWVAALLFKVMEMCVSSCLNPCFYSKSLPNIFFFFTGLEWNDNHKVVLICSPGRRWQSSNISWAMSPSYQMNIYLHAQCCAHRSQRSRLNWFNELYQYFMQNYCSKSINLTQAWFKRRDVFVVWAWCEKGIFKVSANIFTYKHNWKENCSNNNEAYTTE